MIILIIMIIHIVDNIIIIIIIIITIIIMIIIPFVRGKLAPRNQESAWVQATRFRDSYFATGAYVYMHSCVRDGRLRKRRRRRRRSIVIAPTITVAW